MSPVIYIKYLEEPRVSSSSWKKKTSLVYTIREGEEKQPMSGKVQELFKKKKKKREEKNMTIREKRIIDIQVKRPTKHMWVFLSRFTYQLPDSLYTMNVKLCVTHVSTYRE